MRHRARISAFQSIYQLDMGDTTLQEAIAHTIEENELSEKGAEFSTVLTQGWWNAREEIDKTIEENTVGWKLNRMQSVDRNILRLAVYEIIYRPDTSIAVIINEAIELAKVYGDEHSGKFINSILDKIAKKVRNV